MSYTGNKKKSYKALLISIAAVLSVILLLFLCMQMAKNKAIGLEEQIATAKSNIDVQQKRRADLIPNLVECVKAYDKHEYETLLAIIQARGVNSDQDVAQVQTMITAVAEAYPELKSSENYRNLMIELASTENQIAQYRNNYNAQVRNYNRTVRQFPNSFFLSTLGYEPIEYSYLEFDTTPDAPQVIF